MTASYAELVGLEGLSEAGVERRVIGVGRVRHELLPMLAGLRSALVIELAVMAA